MGCDEEQGSAETEPAGADQGTGSGAPGQSVSEHTRKWAQEYESDRLEVTEKIARGELEALIEPLMDEDEERRYELALRIARGEKAVIPRAIELAEDARPRMREMACYILGQVGYLDPEDRGRVIHYPDGIPTLIRRLRGDSDECVRAGAAHALGFHQMAYSAPALCRAAGDSSVEVRYGAAHALGSFYPCLWGRRKRRRFERSVREALLRLMDDEDEDVRDWATFGIHQGDHDTPETRARLWQALDDPNPDVRGEAAEGLAKFGDRSLIPRLDQLLREDPALSSCFFEAAEELGDPALLPAVLAGAERWRAGMKEGEVLHPFITHAIEALEEAAASPREFPPGLDIRGLVAGDDASPEAGSVA